ncbi:MAG: hypothetical protein FWH31_04960 [Streptococcaceae bacterium]|nr:hypothetical protein [Streptococcaceae bacterium]
MGLDEFIQKNGKKDTPFESKIKLTEATKLIKINELLHEELKLYAVKSKLTMKDIAEMAIREYIDKH